MLGVIPMVARKTFVPMDMRHADSKWLQVTQATMRIAACGAFLCNRMAQVSSDSAFAAKMKTNKGHDG